MLYYMLAYMLQ